jgi:lysine-specific demethylase 8
MSWDDFLDVLEDPTHSQTILYMAQHNLLSQFHALREDILIPDYVFTSPEAPATYPLYRPPNNEEGLALNAWLGPPGTASPAHTVCPILLLDLKTPFSAWRPGSIFQLVQ